MSKNTRNRILLTAIAALLLVVVAVGGTLAYLQDATGELTNTFTPTNIDVTLSETKPAGNTAQIIPGMNIEKDPKVNASATEGVAYWVFVEITEGTWLTDDDGNKLLTYNVDSAWTKLGTINNGATTVYYQADADGGEFEDYILAGVDTYTNGAIVVPTTLTDEQMEGAQNSTLTFKAYAIQQATFADQNAGYQAASGNTLDTNAD